MLSSTLLLIFSTLALTPTSHSATLAPRECYKSGYKWNEYGRDIGGRDLGRDNASQALEDLCVPSKLSGFYTRNQKKTACVQMTPTMTAEFSIEWLGVGSYNFTLSDEHCKRGLRAEIYGCDRGGHKEYHGKGHWFPYGDIFWGVWTLR